MNAIPSQFGLDEFVEAFNNALPPSKQASGGNSITDTVAAPTQSQENWAKNLASASCWAQAGNSYFPSQ
jgi:hypothetical protein